MNFTFCFELTGYVKLGQIESFEVMFDSRKSICGNTFVLLALI